jgi:hypothetical protein
LRTPGSRASRALPERRQPVQPPHQPLAITLDGELRALLSTRNRLRAAGQGCALRPLCAGDARPQPQSKETTVECCRRSEPAWWAWLDLNQRPHPYQLNAGNRCADRHFCRSRSTVGVEGNRSIRPLVCVHIFTALLVTGSGRVGRRRRHAQVSAWVELTEPAYLSRDGLDAGTGAKVAAPAVTRTRIPQFSAT